MKVMLFVLLSVASFNLFAAVEFEETVTKINTRSETLIEEAKSELISKAQNTCRISDVVGELERVSDFEIVEVSEQDRTGNDPRCHWRGGCYLPALVHVSAKFLCTI